MYRIYEIYLALNNKDSVVAEKYLMLSKSQIKCIYINKRTNISGGG